jgi:hypothetical protein
MSLNSADRLNLKDHDSWSRVETALRGSLLREAAALERARRLSELVQKQTLALRLGKENASTDGSTIVNLQTSLADALGAAEHAAACEANARAELARERDALAVAASRIEDLASQLERLRQMLTAPPRPPRPVLPATAANAAATPFERWHAEAGLVRFDGMTGRRALSVAALTHIGHAPPQATTTPCCSPDKGQAPVPAGNESNTVELIQHAFWSSHAYGSPSGSHPSRPAVNELPRLGRSGSTVSGAAPLNGALSGGADQEKSLLTTTVAVTTSPVVGRAQVVAEGGSSQGEDAPRALSFTHSSNWARTPHSTKAIGGSQSFAEFREVVSADRDKVRALLVAVEERRRGSGAK